MTTRRLKVERVSAQGLPIFEGFDVSSVEEFSITAFRGLDDSIPAAASAASTALTAALQSLWPRNERQFCLIALGGELQISGKVSAHLAERDKLWGQWKSSGIGLPAGQRFETNLSIHPGRWRYFGSINFETPQLPVALEVTRVADAVCVAAPGNVSLQSLVQRLATRVLDGKPLMAGQHSLLPAVVSSLPEGAIAMRAFGAFDDVNISIDVFGEGHIIDQVVASFDRLLRSHSTER